jgi:hypothetical protein
MSVASLNNRSIKVGPGRNEFTLVSRSVAKTKDMEGKLNPQDEDGHGLSENMEVCTARGPLSMISNPNQ